MRNAIAAAAGAALIGSSAFACELHLRSVSIEPVSTPWPELALNSSPPVASRDGDTLAAVEVLDPLILAWKQNLTGVKGTSPNATINNVVSLIDADVRTVAYDTNYAYVRASGVPSHSVGPFPGNPAAPTDRNRTFRLPRNPVAQGGTKTAVGLGAIGVMVNGVPFFNPQDAASYNNQNVWHQNANVVEAPSFDTGRGHPAPRMQNMTQGVYHYHQSPALLINQLDPGNTGQHHSPIIGYAFDGFPIYGPYGYSDPNDSASAIERVESGYALRSITSRTHLADGTDVADGPAVSGTNPLGYYVEDFGFTGGGDLDLYNGRFTKTPEYPDGIYAYFATLDASGAFYPYLVGPRYYGVVDTVNLGAGVVTVPGDVTYYVAPEPGAAAICGIFLAGGLLRRGRVRR
jgi:hypothetical protein